MQRNKKYDKKLYLVAFLIITLIKFFIIQTFKTHNNILGFEKYSFF